MRSMKRLAVLATAVFAVLVPGNVAYTSQIGTVSGPTAAAQLKKGMNPVTQTPTTAKVRLLLLKVAPAGTMTGYSRDLFPHWRDASAWGWPVEPNNACDARNAALYRDGVGVKMSSTCTNLTGTWTDPYSARVFDSASDIDIDHIVPLANAWRSGAASWTTTKRTQYANDPLVLVSSWDYLNQQKGDKGPEAWKPVNTSAHCLYATRWVHAKGKYNLTITAAEKSALSAMLATC
jgi:hypothetical protein